MPASRAELSRLERLPSELLFLIFNSVWSETYVKQIHPVSRTLRPFLLRNQYRDIEVDYYHFLRLCKTAPHYASLIKTIYISWGTWSSACDWVSDYEFEHEEAIFEFCKAATSLETLGGLNTHPRLQRRLLSAKFAVHCFKSIRSLELCFTSFITDNQERVSDPLAERTRCLSYFSALDELALSFSGERKGQFTLEEEKKFADDDEVELKRRPAVDDGILVSKLRVKGHSVPEDMDIPFAARFRRLQHIALELRDMHEVYLVLRDVEPQYLKTLSIDTLDTGDEEVYESYLGRFVNLELLQLNGFPFDPDLIASLSKLSKLSRIIIPQGTPDASDILILLDPSTRPPSLTHLDFWPPSYIICDGERYRISDYDPFEHGVALPTWKWGWSIALAREVVALAAQEGIELGGAEEWAKSISTTDAYREARGDASEDSEGDDGWITDDRSEIGSEGESESGEEGESEIESGIED